MKFTILTLFPEFFSSPLNQSILKKSRDAGFLEIQLVNIRDFSPPPHQVVDEPPYSGGSGMVIKADVVGKALKSVGAVPLSEKNKENRKKFPKVVHFSPQGRPLTQKLAGEFKAEKEIILLCGHYEGIDSRVESWIDMEVSLGDFVLSGGELPALAFLETVSRLIPGVLGNPESLSEESFASEERLEYPQYTRPVCWEGQEVPEVLRSGNQKKISDWRRLGSLYQTLKKRPELFSTQILQEEERKDLLEIIEESLELDRRLQPEEVFLGLVHFPVLGKEKEIIRSSITNLDIHDLSRLSTSYGLGGLFFIGVGEEETRILHKMLEHWKSGAGSEKNPDRKQALGIARIVPDIQSAKKEAEKQLGKKVKLVGTTAGRVKQPISPARIRRKGKPLLILLGTAWGLAPEVMHQVHFTLSPITTGSGFNHLSVRTAAAIIMDRLLGKKEWK